VDGAWPLEELLAEAAEAPSWDLPSTRRVTLGDAAFTIFTSGTTGLPKASVMTHLRWVTASAVYARVFLQLTPQDVLYVPLPFFHNMALTAAWSAACRAGAAVALAPRFSASRFWDDCRQFGATCFPYIGEIPRYLLAQPPSPRDRDHSVTRIFGVGMRPELWLPFCERFGIPDVIEHYAASEANTMFLNPLNIPGSVGFCVSRHVLVQYDVDAGEMVRDAAGKPIKAARGEAGLLLCAVSERFRFDGYTDPEESEKKLHRDLFKPGDVWFDSGDLLRKVGWGHAEFVDRVGDTFRWKSENVSTGQVEAILGTHPGVEEVAVYGVLVEGTPGRAGMAAVVCTEDLDRGDLLAWLRRELPGSAVPVFLRIKESLETTGTHKHRKVDLKREGFDPSATTDPLYVARSDGWARLDPALYAEIQAGRVRL
jgi:acyl-CoA synthetase (AMP-forming)/AMP-acid ligase II